MRTAHDVPVESGPFKVLGDERFAAALPKLIADVAGEATTAEVASRIVHEFVRTLGARTARVYVVGSDGPALSADLPAARALRSGRPELVDRKYAAGEGVTLALPLLANATPIGALSADFDELRSGECPALFTLSASLGAILDRARLREEVGRLERSARDRDGHAALVAHELRQRLNVVLLSATFLANCYDRDELGTVDRMREAAHLLDGMISDLVV
jgi:signal transduction histidine kinase